MAVAVSAATLAQQPLGWDPDLDDGVRQKIRPFLQTEVLAYAPNILQAVDRGKNVSSAPGSTSSTASAATTTTRR